jgi:UDPglucose--hexose-1-phosphate uridylyltransferase
VSSLPRRDVVHPDGRWFHLYGDVDADTVTALEHADRETGYDPSHLQSRFDRLTGSWVLVSPSRNVRPSAAVSGAGAPACPLCPGGPELPGPYELAVFDNRFPSLSPEAPEVSGELVAPSRGRCLVVVYTSEHVANVAELTPQQLVDVVTVWRDRTSALWEAGHRYVMAFENHGNEVGATLPHLHGQIYAIDHEPPAIGVKRRAHEAHRSEHGTCLGCTLVADDVDADRVIHENDHFVAASPFASRWPLEVHVRAKRHGVRRLGDLSDAALTDLASALDAVISRYDGLWGFELPYLMCVQEAPDGVDDWHLHVEMLPPHRNQTRLKVRASVETALGVFINDTLPEANAEALAAVPVTLRDFSLTTVRSIAAVGVHA